MTGATADGEHIDLVELLHRSDLPAVDRCRVYDAIVSSMIKARRLIVSPSYCSSTSRLGESTSTNIENAT
jgi:hypothetical protein